MKQFAEVGAAVIALCPQLQHFNEEIVSQLSLSFPVLRDEGNQIATAFGLTLPQPNDVVTAEQSLGLDLPAHNGIDNWDLPIPARYVIDSKSRVLYTAFHVDHRLRTEPRECIGCMTEA